MIIERLTPALVVAAAVAPRSAAKSPGTFAAHPGTKTFEMIKPLNLLRAIGDPRFDVGGSEDARSIMSDDFDGLDAMEKAGIGATLNRCRALATKIGNELRNKRPEHFVDKLSLPDVHASLERAADVLSTVKGSQVRGTSGRQAAGARLGRRARRPSRRGRRSA